MSLEADTIVDRRRLKRRLLFWRVVAVLALLAAATAVFSRFDGIERGEYVSRLFIDGLILEDVSRETRLGEIAATPRFPPLPRSSTRQPCASWVTCAG